MTPQDLKASILQLAIQGKLVPQIPEEGTGEELFQQIQAEKQRLVKAAKIKKEKPLPEITEDELPFDIPENWRWVRWGDLSQSIQYGYNAPAQEKGRIKMVRISDIQDGKVLWDTVPYCDIKEDDIPTYLLGANDILFARTGGTVGKSYLVKEVPEEAIYAGYLIRTQYSSLLCPEYMKYFMESQLYWDQLRNGTIATAQPNCNGKTLSKMILPLPPLAEQKRIVAKIEELLPLIDRYEQAWSKLEEFNKRFPVDMQKSILQMAIQGKLVPQIPEEGTGEELFQQIQTEKQRLVKAGTIKKEKSLPEITEEEVPFDIPDSWKWVQFGEIANILGTGLVRSSSEQYLTAQYYYFKMNNIGNFDGKCHFDNMNMINATPEEYERYKIEKGDFLFNTRNSRELVGKTAVVPNINLPIILNNNILKIRLLGGIIPEYINCFFNSPLGREQLVKFITNTTNVAAIYQKQIVTLYVPLPPLAEQKRIFAKLEEILPLCERLK